MKTKILSKQWVWFWSGNWPLLDDIYERDRLFQTEFRKIAGDYPRVTLDFYSKGIITAYHSQKEYNRLEKHFLAKFQKSPEFIIKSYDNYSKRIGLDIKELRKISNMPVKQMKNQQLVRLFKKTRHLFACNAAYDHYCWYIEKFFIPVLENYLKKHIRSESEVVETLTLLVTPQKESMICKERKNFFRMLDAIRKNPVWKTAFFTNNVEVTPDPELHHILNSHIERFCYLCVLVNNPPTTKEQLINELGSYLIDQKKITTESVRLGDIYNPDVKKKVEQMIKRLDPPKRIVQLVEGLRETAFVRTEDNAVMGLSTYLIMPLQKEIAKRIGITYTELKELVPEEIIFYLRYHLPVPKKLIMNRRKASGHYIEDDEIYFFLPYAAEKIRNSIESREKTEIINPLKGQAASPGKTSANAFVVKSSAEDLSGFKTGQVLIAPATSADFVPLMRKAAAVLTEMGGITSHAAIVSREFGIPCIVGVKEITKLVKNGDKVEVNADEGIIRII